MNSKNNLKCNGYSRFTFVIRKFSDQIVSVDFIFQECRMALTREGLGEWRACGESASGGRGSHRPAFIVLPKLEAMADQER